MSVRRWIPVAVVTLAAAAFALMNRGERVAVDLGIATLYRAPLTTVVFAAFLAGMLAMLALGLRHDLRVRRELRARGLLDAPPPARPAVSAWGVTREPAASEADDRTVAYPRYDEDPVA